MYNSISKLPVIIIGCVTFLFEIGNELFFSKWLEEFFKILSKETCKAYCCWGLTKYQLECDICMCICSCISVLCCLLNIIFSGQRLLKHFHVLSITVWINCI